MKKFISLSTLVLICCMSALSQPGSLDLSFGKEGKLLFNFSNENSNVESGKKVFALPDGKIIVAFTARLAIMTKRLLADGSIDTTYGNHGYSDVLPIRGSNAEIQSDGKIVIVGSKFLDFGGSGSSFIALGRLTAEGKIDNSFDEDGIKVLTNYGDMASVGLVPISIKDGKILIVNQYQENAPPYNNGILLIRFNSDGSFDPTFGDQGIAKVAFPDCNSPRFCSILIDTENKIIGVGSYRDASWVDQQFMAKFNSNGSLNADFGINGFKALDFNFNANLNIYLKTATLLSDEKLLVAGFTIDNSIYPSVINIFTSRLMPNGSLDSSYYISGISAQGGDISIGVQKSGKTLLSSGSASLMRFNADGTSDTLFGDHGKIESMIDGNNIYDGSLTVASPNEIFVTGSFYSSQNNSNCVVIKYDTLGIPDSSFSATGMANVFIEGSISNATSLYSGPDGKLLCVGSSNYNIALAKFSKSGTVDPTFGSNGKITTSLVNTGPSVIQPDGKLLVAANEFNNLRLIRFDNSGNFDVSFADSGKIALPTLPDYMLWNIVSIAMQGHEKILVLAIAHSLVNFREYSLILSRFYINGTLDNSFANNGMQLLPAGTWVVGCSGSNCIYDYKSFTDARILVRDDSKINITGSLANDPSSPSGYINLFLARLNADGSFDTNFDTDGTIVSSFFLHDMYNLRALIQKDNKIIVGSGFDLMRLNENGIIDNSFSISGNPESDFFGKDIALQEDGKILRIGFLHSSRNRLYRYNSTGSVDTTFGNKGYVEFFRSFEDGYLTNLLINDNKVYACGEIYSPFQTALIEAVKLSDSQNSTSPVEFANNLTVSPNPSKNEFILKIESHNNEPIELKVYDMVGRKVYSTKGPADRQYNFGGSFSEGIYMAEVMLEGKRLMVKLIKQ